MAVKNTNYSFPHGLACENISPISLEICQDLKNLHNKIGLDTAYMSIMHMSMSIVSMNIYI